MKLFRKFQSLKKNRNIKDNINYTNKKLFIELTNIKIKELNGTCLNTSTILSYVIHIMKNLIAN